ncbi:MAG: hypothetical protein IMF19_04850, partial [Proteobacteria bacterium]|nr:hypothetical protein [Pseudomonadota bacterium]
MNHKEFPANCTSEKETHIQDSEELLACIPPSKQKDAENAKGHTCQGDRPTVGLLENPECYSKAKEKEQNGEQYLLDAALDYCKASQEFWAEGYLN